jgi:hypothetical protein
LTGRLEHAKEIGPLVEFKKLLSSEMLRERLRAYELANCRRESNSRTAFSDLSIANATV